MGLPAYVINRDELKQLINQALNTASIKVRLDGASLSGSDFNLDISPVEEKVDELLTVISDQSISSDAFLMAVNNVMAEMDSLYSIYDEKVYEFSNTVALILAEKLRIKELLEQILDYLSVTGQHQTLNLHRSITAQYGVFYLTHTATRNMLLSSINVYQNLYDFADYWELRHNGKTVFNKVYTKYTGEKKNFASLRRVSPSDTIEILFYNHSANSKTINYDIDFLAI